jgi:hypothetical protein
MLEFHQVGIASDHFRWQLIKSGVLVDSQRLMTRIRHCVECPKCGTRYLVPCSPYRNGSYLIPTVVGSWEEYVLYCSCRIGNVASRWKWSEMKKYEITKAAYERGFGTSDEILLIQNAPQEAWSPDVSRYLDNWKSMEKRKNSL